LTIGRNLNSTGLISIGSIYSSNYLYGNTNITHLKTNEIQGASESSVMTIGSNLTTGDTQIMNAATQSGTLTLGNSTNTVNIALNRPLTPGYTYPVGTGKIGEVLSTLLTSSYTVTETFGTIMSLTPTSGVWMASLIIACDSASRDVGLTVQIRVSGVAFIASFTPMQNYSWTTASINYPIVLTATSTLDVVANKNNGNGPIYLLATGSDIITGFRLTRIA